MNSLMQAKKTDSQLDSNEDLAKQVFSIVDSKIQYLKFMIKDAVKDYVDVDVIKTLPPKTAKPFFQNFDEIMKKNGLIFEMIERYNRSLSMMLLVRKKINKWNSNVVLLLLSDEQYLNYSEENLEMILHRTHHHDYEIPHRVSDN